MEKQIACVPGFEFGLAKKKFPKDFLFLNVFILVAVNETNK